MARKTQIKITNTLGKGIAKFKAEYPKVKEKALISAGAQLLNWIANGSPKNSTVPPLLTGVLRGSGSLFVGSKFITATPDLYGNGDPNTSHAGKKDTITIGYQTDYAKRLHETSWTPGEKSERSGDVGNKWIRKHLASDKDLLFAFIAKIYKENF